MFDKIVQQCIQDLISKGGLLDKISSGVISRQNARGLLISMSYLVISGDPNAEDIMDAGVSQGEGILQNLAEIPQARDTISWDAILNTLLDGINPSDCPVKTFGPEKVKEMLTTFKICMLDNPSIERCVQISQQMAKEYNYRMSQSRHISSRSKN